MSIIDRGTFLPIDAYSSGEIELIADESFGQKRRELLDELKKESFNEIIGKATGLRRELEGNAERIKSFENKISDAIELVESYADAQDRYDALPKLERTHEEAELLEVSEAERKLSSNLELLEAQLEEIKNLESDLTGIVQTYSNRLVLKTEEGSCKELIENGASALEALVNQVRTSGNSIKIAARKTSEVISKSMGEVKEFHEKEKVKLGLLKAENEKAGKAIAFRNEVELSVRKLQDAKEILRKLRAELDRQKSERKVLKGSYLLELDQLSELRTEIANDLTRKAGSSVRIRVLRNSDTSNYREILLQGLKGARVRNHDAIIERLMTIRPEELAQILGDEDVIYLEHQISLGEERTQRVLAALTRNLDRFSIELTEIEDHVRVELNVGSSGEPNFKDAAELSQGQKCTALLPLLLARRNVPIIVDQPEDNLDNHFVYNTVIEVLRRLKSFRQMIFVTHNANIPVLGEADFVIVMNSDGKKGIIEKSGSLDDCREEIIDLLEGGDKAFELRRKRYGK